MISFETDRFYDIVDKQGSGWSFHGYFASTHHCYGYTCCEVTFPAVSVHYRFRSDAGWTDEQLGDSKTLEVDIPHDAEQLEVWFAVTGYDVRAWYCACDASSAAEYYRRSTPQWHDFNAWDSHYGANYVFPLQQAATLPTVRFGAITDAPTVQGELRAGQPARISYDRGRFYSIINGSLSYGYFASSFHCYGYGCCEVDFPQVGVHYRFDATPGWQDELLSSADDLLLDVPAGAQQLEVWFDVPGFNIRTWYCACDASCVAENYDRSTPRWSEFQAWDSGYGKNHVFAVLP